jgi:hypothetical protein
MQKNSPVFPLFQKGIDAKMKELTLAGIFVSFDLFAQARRTCGTTHFIRPCTILFRRL